VTRLVQGLAEAVRWHPRKVLVLLAFVAGIAGGAGLYFGVDGYYVRVSANHVSARPDVQPLNGNPRPGTRQSHEVRL
jgi:hypothetical protein